MKLAIHNDIDFAERWGALWVEYCKKNNIPFIEVDCYANDIIQTLKQQKVTHLMWAFSQAVPKDHLIARSVLNAAAQMGIKTFPNFESNWFFDDKIAQKYLLEAIGVPMAESYCFFDKKTAEAFARTAGYPLVAKLRKGSGSNNVRILHDAGEADKYIRRMFDKGGVCPVSSMSARSQILNKVKSVARKDKPKIPLRNSVRNFFMRLQRHNLFPKEVGYLYLQEFLPGNTSDLRIVVVGERIWGFFRGVKKNDFRASGSGLNDYDTPVPADIVRKSYEITQLLGTQSLCFDYVKAQDGSYKIIEISYGYENKTVAGCRGYWNKDLVYHEDRIMPVECILNDFIKE